MVSYFELRTNMSRGQDDGTAKKKVCTWRVEYFRQEAGLLESVSVFEDAFVYASPAHPFTVPATAVPSTAGAYAAAEAKLCPDERRHQADARAKARAKHAPVVLPTLDDFTVLDLEFQGSDLLELAAIRYQNWQPVAELVSFVQYTGPISSVVSQLTGIQPQHVAQAPPARQVLQDFRRLAGDSVLVCHNISADRRILEGTRTQLGATEPLPNDWLCTLALAKKRLPKGQKCSLTELCNEFGIDAHGAHRALRDVQMCFEVLQHFHQQRPVGAESFHSAAAGKRKAGQAALFAEAA
jgi:DNA polymerase III epsilon subunit-like protein